MPSIIIHSLSAQQCNRDILIGNSLKDGCLQANLLSIVLPKRLELLRLWHQILSLGCLPIPPRKHLSPGAGLEPARHCYLIVLDVILLLSLYQYLGFIHVLTRFRKICNSYPSSGVLSYSSASALCRRLYRLSIRRLYSVRDSNPRSSE